MASFQRQEVDLGSALQYFQDTQYSLPKLPLKTKSRLDHHRFREYASKAAEERAKQLEAKIESLNESEKLLKGAQKKLRGNADDEFLDASRVQEEAKSILRGITENNLQDLYAKTIEQFNKTQKALKKALVGLERAWSFGQDGGLRTISQLLLMMQIEKKTAKMKKKQLEQERIDLKAKIDEIQRYTSIPSGDSLLKTEDDDADSIADKGKEMEDDTYETEIDRWKGKMRERLDQKMRDTLQNLTHQRNTIKRLDEETMRLEMRYKEEMQKENEKALEDSQEQIVKRETELRKMKETIIAQLYRYSDTNPETTIKTIKHILRGRMNSESELPSRYATDSLFDEKGLKAEGRLLKLMERLISDAQLLETHIQRIQDHCNTFGDVTNLKQVLEPEFELEQKWLDYLKNANSVEPNGNSTSHLSDQYPTGQDTSKAKIYDSLRKDHFRVLVLAPAPEPYYPLVCKLETWPIPKSRSTGKEYAALSYVWGQGVDNGRLCLLPPQYDTLNLSNSDEWGYAMKRTVSIPIRDNLFRALLRLRKYGPGSQPVALWVDFICINQASADEKTEQLPRMVDIYRNARNVCVWLGESDEEGRSDEAMEFISTTMDFAVLDRLAHDKRHARRWYALGELMRDRWFSRRWVVQEIALAKEATVHCGGKIVRWTDFADAASLLVSNQEVIKSLFDLSEWREGRNTLGDVNSFGASILLEATNNLFRRKPNGEIKKPIKTIESLVTSLRTFDAGDQRDLIYSLVSIAKDTSYHVWDHGSHDDPQERCLRVNYSQSHVAVYSEFTQFCIYSSKSLDIICRPWAMPLRNKTVLPSWIPLLSKSEFGVPGEVYSGRKNGEVLVGSAGSPNYGASGKSQFDGRFEPQDDSVQAPNSDIKDDHVNSPLNSAGMILVARGFRLARIEEVSPRSTGGVIFRESLAMGGWMGFKRDTTFVPDPIWRTLVADRDQEGRVPPSWYQRACLRCLEVAEKFNNGDLNIGELLQGHSDTLRKFLMRMRNVTWSRRFFKATILAPQPEETHEDQKTTSSQPNEPIDPEDIEPEEEETDENPTTSFGLCPPETKAGDFICILYGCTVPVVLREGRDGHMQLVGEAYVHGKMDGEAIEEFMEHDTWKDEEFRIR
ncbi:heterokaryon incompatibility protein-domain-containing protein [Rostrohypoxylon terebratum]|nr:heterokaryon incompatibility protein-domain-containing protein [Rostrohypoxylon terebratum]